MQDASAPAGISSITQSSDGFVWLSSISGDAYRFDGVQFVPWRFYSDDTIRTFRIFGDHTGGLWALGSNGVVYQKHGMPNSSFEVEGLRQLQTVSEDADGSIWIVRSSGTVLNKPLCHLTPSAVRCFGKSDGIPISPLNSLLADGSGGFWLGGQTSLVHWHDGSSQVYRIEGLKSNAGQLGIVSLARDPDGSLWVGIKAEGPGLGLGRFAGGSVRSFVTPTFDGSKIVVTSTIFDRDGNLWVATSGAGIFRIHAGLVEHYGHADGLSGDSVLALFEDREGIVWAGSTNGIDNFRDPRITTFSALQGLGKDAAAGVLASRDGTIWVANAESLDHIVNGVVSSIRTGSGLPGHQVTSLLEDHAGHLLVGVDNELYSFVDGRFRRIPDMHHQPLGMAVWLTEDTEGNVWGECRGSEKKLVRIRNFAVVEEFSSPKFPAGRALAADPHSGIWIGTSKGKIAQFRHGVLDIKFALNAEGDPVSSQFEVQPDGSVVATSENGLAVWRQGKLQRLTMKNGLPCNSVFSFIQDKEKLWWLFTGCGVVEVADSEIQRWWSDPNAVVQTRVDDVLDGAEPGEASFNSAAYSTDGRVWFATGHVVQMIDPSKLSQKALPAETHIESLIVDRKELLASQNLKLSPHPRDLQIDYTSPTFLMPQRLRFRYRLEGYDREWHDAGTRRQAFYTDLPPGKFSFRVMARNSDGIWNSAAAQLNFSIEPAYHQTNWFRALCVAVFLASLWAAYQFRMRQLHQQFALTLEARVAERTRIARELHDTLLQGAHGLLLRFETVSQLLPDRPQEAKEKLDSAIVQTAAFVTEARDEVQGLRDSTLQNNNDLAMAISVVGEELASNAPNQPPPMLRVAVEGEARNLHPILRDEIFKISAEALRNAFRHAQARQIEVEIRYDNEQVRLRVRDNGRGIDPVIVSGQGSEGHYGLPGMRERAALIGGKLDLWSELGAGTELELRVPAAVAYATAPRRSWLSINAKTGR